MRYQVKVHRRAVKFLEETPSHDREKIKERISHLVEPYKVKRIRIRGEKNVYRLRVGSYRVLYSVFDDEKLVLVLNIDKRSKIYK